MLEGSESVGEYEEVAEEEARRISTSLGCSSSCSGKDGGQGEGWQQSLETPTTQPPAATGRNTLIFCIRVLAVLSL